VSFIKLSIIVPVYNEEERINLFLNELYNFTRDKEQLEIIFINDGSKDKSLEILENFRQKEPKSRIISYKNNKGKCYAVKQGVIYSRGKKIIFIDADNSIHPKEIDEMSNLLDKYDVVVGDREHKESKVEIPKKRKVIGTIFNYIVRILFQSGVKDNLCGFKGFKKDIAKKLFNDIYSTGWIFDVELFYKIKKNHYSLYFKPIEWEYREGSKIKLTDPIKMFINLIKLRIRLLNG
jgi:glycosyltransferase involved in cell wall biosynthesis